MKTSAAFILLLVLAGCANLERSYGPAGFDSYEEAVPYVLSRDYLQAQLTGEDWNAFYKRFPEHKKNLRDQEPHDFLARLDEQNPVYAAYCFRWTTLFRKVPNWSQEKIARLKAGDLQPGDTPFEIFYAWGVPPRKLLNRGLEVLFYQPDKALIMESGVFREMRPCPGCWEFPVDHDADGAGDNPFGMTDAEIISRLELKPSD